MVSKSYLFRVLVLIYLLFIYGVKTCQRVNLFVVIVRLLEIAVRYPYRALPSQKKKSK